MPLIVIKICVHNTDIVMYAIICIIKVCVHNLIVCMPLIVIKISHNTDIVMYVINWNQNMCA